MKDNLIPALRSLLKHEGGFVNNPHDPGGMTNLGVTQKVWEEWLGHPVTEKDMRALTAEVVAPMYKRKYWDKIAGDELPSGVDMVVFDCAVNSGPGRAAKMLQKVLGVTEDGVIGNQTIAMIGRVNVDTLITDYSSARLAFLTALPTWGVFGKGWGQRVADVSVEAQTLA
jgi:lysozyme family protein